jgi:hypothetical protein
MMGSLDIGPGRDHPAELDFRETRRNFDRGARGRSFVNARMARRTELLRDRIFEGDEVDDDEDGGGGGAAL